MVRLIPKDTSFFQMFSAMSDNLIAGARSLVELFADYRDVDNRIDSIRRIEREGDELTHAILTKLNQTFITPKEANARRASMSRSAPSAAACSLPMAFPPPSPRVPKMTATRRFSSKIALAR